MISNGSSACDFVTVTGTPVDMKHGMVLNRRKYSYRYEAQNGAGQKEIFI
jgi:hypothetical protein